MSGEKTRATPGTALEDALRRIRVLERIPAAAGPTGPTGPTTAAAFPWLRMTYDAYTTIPQSPSPADAQGYVVPLVADTGGDYTSDSSIFTPHVGSFDIKAEGLYYASIWMTWFMDFGRCATALLTVQEFDTHQLTNQFGNADTYATYLGGSVPRSGYYEGYSGGHNRVVLTNEYWFGVKSGSSFPAGPNFVMNVDNLSGSDQTFGVSEGHFLAILAVFQLSEQFTATIP